MRPLTEKIPKALVKVAGRPFAELQVERLRSQGISRVVWLVGYRAHQIEEALGDGSRWGMRFEYLNDGPTLLGTGGALQRALPALGFDGVSNVHVGRLIELDVDDPARLGEMCEKLLANPLVEDYETVT